MDNMLAFINKLLDYILHTKFYMEETYLYNNILYHYNKLFMMTHMIYHKYYISDCSYCDNNILSAVLYRLGDEVNVDITADFKSLLKNGELKWRNITDDIGDHIYVKYKLGNKVYRIVYKCFVGEEDKILFPPYSSGEVDLYNKKTMYQQKIIHAEIAYDNDKLDDITELLDEYTGALNNFYKDKGIFMTADMLLDDNGEKIMKSDYDEIYMTDSFGDTTVFGRYSILGFDVKK